MKIWITNEWQTYDLHNDQNEAVIHYAIDWEYPGLASIFGWSPCDCGFTDGTVDCEHRTVREMIMDAESYIVEHEYEQVENDDYAEVFKSLED